MVTIAQIIAISYKEALKVAKDGRHWVSHELEALQKAGRIKIMPLGVCVEKFFDDKHGNITSKKYPIEEISFPCMWSKNDEVKNPTEDDKISLVTSLFENAWNTHDDVLLSKIGSGSAVVSRNYRYDRGEVIALPASNTYLFTLYTVVAIID